MRALALAAAATALLTGGVLMTVEAGAQTQPPAQRQIAQASNWQQKYDSCANEGRFGKQLSGQQLIDYISNCTKQARAGSSQPPSNWNMMYEACADEGRFQRNLSGQQLTDFIWQCASQPVSGTSLPPTEASWQDKRRACANTGRNQKGLSGDQLVRYIDTCLAAP